MATEPINVPDATHEPAAYKQALLALSQNTDPLTTLSQTIKEWRSVTSGLTDDQLTARPAKDDWSIAELTGHLFDVDLVFGFRARLILTAERPTYPGYDEKLFARFPRPRFTALLDAWEGLRDTNLLIFAAAPPNAATRTAIHQKQGPETYEELIHKMAGHDVVHVNQLKRTAEAVGYR
jgi:hypothetical protein